MTEILPFINDNLIFLPENKDFIPLERHDESCILKIIKENDKQKIEDSFFFASVKQIELDKLLNDIFEFDNPNEIGNKNYIIKEDNDDKFKEIIKLKKISKKNFFKDSVLIVDI